MNYYAWTLPLNLDLLATGGEVAGLGWQLEGSEVRAIVRRFSPLHTIPGVIALAGGGFYSYISWQLSIRRTEGKFRPKAGFFNIFIAVGVLITGQGALLSGFGFAVLYITEVFGVILMYLVSYCLINQTN